MERGSDSMSDRYLTMAKTFFGTSHPLFNAFGVEVEEVGKGRAAMSLSCRPALCDRHGGFTEELLSRYWIPIAGWQYFPDLVTCVRLRPSICVWISFAPYPRGGNLQRGGVLRGTR